MTTNNIGIFQALSAKMDYLNHRQRVIAQNVANADTPGYTPVDLTPVDFGRILEKVTSPGRAHVSPDTTHKNHMPAAGEIADAKNREQRLTYEVAPAGNAVVMEEQMVKAAQNAMDYNLMTTIYQKNVQMMRMAIGGQ